MERVSHEFETTIIKRLAALGRRLRWYALVDGLAVVSAALLFCVLVTLAVDYTARLGWDMRVTQLASLLVALLVLIWWSVLRPLRAHVRIDDLAVLVEHKYPQLASILISAVEFARTPDAAASESAAMRAAVIHGAMTEAAALSFDAVLAHARARRRAAVAIGCVAAIAVMSLGARDTMGLWLSRNVLLQNVPWPQRNRLRVENLTDGKLIVPRNEDVTVLAVVDHGYEPPRQAFVEFENEAGVHGREQMPAISQEAVRFTRTFERLAASLRCRVVGGDATTDWFDIEVVDRPQIANAVIHIAPPGYTRQPAYELRAGQTIAEVLPGSRLNLRCEANKPLVRATLLREEGGRQVTVGPAESSDGVHFKSAINKTSNATYEFELLDRLGLTNRSERLMPMRFSIRLIADKPPVVKMRIRDVGDMVTRQAVLPIEGTFNDEYGLASAGVHFEIAHTSAASQPTSPALSEPADTQPVTSSPDEPPASQPASSSGMEPIVGFEPGTRSFVRTVDWPVDPHGLVEGDRLSLNCQAADFDDVSGPNVGKSPVLTLRVVSQEELLTDLGRREQEHRRDFERLLREQEQLYADLLATSRPAGDEGREYFARLARRQRDHAGRLNLMRLQFEQVLNKMRINRLATPAVEARLGQGVIEPMDALYRTSMPQAAVAMESLPPEATGDSLKAARAAQEQVLAEMNRIMSSLLKWEGYQEAVTLLRDVLKMQKDLQQETERKVEEQIIGK